MTDVMTIENRNGAVEVRINPAATRVHVEGVFDILAGENKVRLRFFDIVGADDRRVDGVETLALSMSAEAARELHDLLGQVIGAQKPPAPPPARAAPPKLEPRVTLHET